MITGKISFPIRAQGVNPFLNIYIEKIRQKSQLKSRNLSEEKKPPRSQIFGYFCYKSRNKNLINSAIITFCRTATAIAVIG